MALTWQPGGRHVGGGVDVDDGDGDGAWVPMVIWDLGYSGGRRGAHWVAKAMTNPTVYMRRPEVDGGEVQATALIWSTTQQRYTTL